MDSLKRFEANPESFRAEGEHRPAPVFLDEALVREFLAWSLHEKKNTRGWVKQKRALALWAEKLKGIDLRRANLREHVLPALVGEASRDQKIRVLKALFSWLRKKKDLLSAAEDCTYGTLTASQARPAQWRKSNAIPRCGRGSPRGRGGGCAASAGARVVLARVVLPRRAERVRRAARIPHFSPGMMRRGANWTAGP
jgi:hypothetical protein